MKRAAGHRWEAFARSVIDYYGGTCHICSHGGARQADHLQPVTERPDLAYVLSNCRPAHGAPGNPCPQCSAAAGRSIHCNQIRGAMTIERARRKIAGWIEENQGTVKPAPARDRGRDW
jgi:hypothetical protein